MDGYSEADGYGNSKIRRQMRSVWCSSNMKPRFRAEWVVVREELLKNQQLLSHHHPLWCGQQASCLLRPVSRNSELEELEDLQSSRKIFGLDHREGDLCWSLSESEGRKEKAECHLRRGDGLGNKRK